MEKIIYLIHLGINSFSVSDHFDCIFMNRFHMKSRRIYLLLKRKCNGHVGAAPEDIYQRESSFFTRTTK